MRRIAVINQKGGVGKTTTTVNLAAALAAAGKRVCVLDLDPQAHASTHLGVEPNGTLPSLYDVMVSNKPLAEVRRAAGENLWVLPTDINLAAADEVFIPRQPHFLALHGLGKLLETTGLVARRINPGLKVGGVVICLYDGSTKLAQEVVSDLKGFLDQSRGSGVPWAAARVFE